MNPDRDALEGLVNSNDAGSAEGLPSVSPYLVEHLIAHFKFRPTGEKGFEASHANNHRQIGINDVISYLSSFLPKAMQGEAHEPTQTESASTDTRRPSTSRRR